MFGVSSGILRWGTPDVRGHSFDVDAYCSATMIDGQLFAQGREAEVYLQSDALKMGASRHLKRRKGDSSRVAKPSP